VRRDVRLCQRDGRQTDGSNSKTGEKQFFGAMTAVPDKSFMTNSFLVVSTLPP
jgi:hypothetical protein